MSVPPDIERHLRDFEERLLDLAKCSSEEVAAILDDAFLEFGKSGRIYDKRSVLAALGAGAAGSGGGTTSRSIADFRATLLAPGAILLTYRVTEHSAVAQTPLESLRSSIWVEREERWKLAFHQGTPLVPG